MTSVISGGQSTAVQPCARGDAVHLCRYDLLSMPRCRDAVLRTEGGDNAHGVCIYVSVAKTDRGLDFVCHHPGRWARD
jgi:hypothetical protein